LGGVIALGIWAGSNIIPAAWQDWEGWVFDREVRNDPANFAAYFAEKKDRTIASMGAWLGFRVTPRPSSDYSPAAPPAALPDVRRPVIGTNGLIGRLSIPRLHLSAIVREGTGEDTLGLTVGHIPSTSLPGQKGNVGVAGHRDKLFRGLEEIRKNDVIQFETLTGNYVYQVESTEIVDPRNVSVLRPRERSALTLVTCYPFYYIGSAPDRFIVEALQVSENPVPYLSELEQETRRGANPSVVSQAVVPQETFEKTTHLDRHQGAAGKISFSVATNHSRQLARGISLGLTQTELSGQRVNGWMWIMPERRTIWLRDQGVQDPIEFYQDGELRELVITNVTSSSITGYLR
jgi:sortase A